MEKKKHRKLKKILLVLGCVIVILAIGTFADWTYAAVNGNVQSHGLVLLER